mmetsp:Transcript_4773/g.12326  ORF Transcript_4773/g.12326 Transcript_4773/m.12326 type:complete len:260 (-) Transcript_4773:654-1433(-)|eukprot:CAMPEP_0197415462 /NCGR_PEP_ID=MMETSP1170-20131217/1993_1 /TAXON_ID=54406 /ORGANISM="Sarcinochrysis sp, Strain CCMP770" /LENGTH=259 /DNA_ID=CAMNT_0042942267 /DNA_START=19 /DNA_END=798 /DNA_ORIENTATION=-
MFGKTGYRTGGTRGGASEFKWENVRGDDAFLGASMHAPRQGRRDLDRDWFWYNKTTDTLGRKVGDTAMATARRRLEILERKRADEDALADALGETAESRTKQSAVDVEIDDLRKFLERGGTERDRLDTERKAGLGAAPAKRHDHVVRDDRVAREIERQAKARRERELLAADAARRRALDRPVDQEPQPAPDTFVRGVDDDAVLRGKRDRDHDDDDDRGKDDRLERKLRKKLKKAKKKAKKDDRRRARKGGSSPPGSDAS